MPVIVPRVAVSGLCVAAVVVVSRKPFCRAPQQTLDLELSGELTKSLPVRAPPPPVADITNRSQHLKAQRFIHQAPLNTPFVGVSALEEFTQEKEKKQMDTGSRG